MCFRLRDTQVRRHLPLTEQVAVRRGVSLRMCMQSLVRQKRHRPLASHSCLFAHRFSHPRLFGRIPSKPHSLLSFLRNLSLLTSLKNTTPTAKPLNPRSSTPLSTDAKRNVQHSFWSSHNVGGTIRWPIRAQSNEPYYTTGLSLEAAPEAGPVVGLPL